MKRQIFIIIAVLVFLSSCGKEPEFKSESNKIKDVKQTDAIPADKKESERAEKPAFKGMELYSWKRADGVWQFALMIGTNRQKTIDEIISKGTEIPELKKKLSKLAKGESIIWNLNPGFISEKLEMPPQEMINDLKEYCKELGIQLTIWNRQQGEENKEIKERLIKPTTTRTERLRFKKWMVIILVVSIGLIIILIPFKYYSIKRKDKKRLLKIIEKTKVENK